MKTPTDDQMLTQAYQSLSAELSRYARSKLHPSTMCDDLVQTTFMKAWQYLQAGGRINAMRPFLCSVLNHLIIDEYRKKKTISLDLLAEEGLEFAAATSENIPDIIDGKMLVVLIEKLPEKYRRVITMRYAKDLSFKEMSVVTHQSQNTISVQVCRGLAKLKVLSLATRQPVATI